MYKLTQGSGVTRLSDGVQLPADPANGDYAAYLEWVALGNTPMPADPVPGPSPIDEIRAIERAPATSDAMKRASRLVALSYALDDLIRIAASKGQNVTRQQAHDWAMLNDSNYKKLYDAEQVIKPLRALV